MRDLSGDAKRKDLPVSYIESILACVNYFQKSISQIGDHVKIENSVVLDGVVIGDHSTLNGVLALDEASIGAKVEVKDSLIGFGVCVDPGTKATNETIVKNMMEI